MLNFKEKIEIFTSYLNQEELSYADSFNAHIDICGINNDYDFLKKIDSKEEIIFWIEKLKSRIVMKEDEAVLEDIIDDYVLCG
ncbi:MAG: hypothetical protein DRQ51_10300 [Gammaproteobacteria bacterium]|nr:MAG: hypothetical protein DRQ51_10300 [Gammaproteobacteria bacterium]